MTSRIWTKAQTQSTIKAMRDAGYTVNKINSGYECIINGETILKAMIGNNGYLVRYANDLFA